jgi:hypothetical protein
MVDNPFVNCVRDDIHTYSNPNVLYGSEADDVLDDDEEEELLFRFAGHANWLGDT